MSKIRQQHNLNSDDDLNEQINDKLSELWAGMKNKKRQLLRNLTPSYSRRSQRASSQLNSTSNPQNNYLTSNNQADYSHNSTQNQLFKIKQKIVSQESGSKLKEGQIEKLKNIISQLNNDKKILVKELQSLTNNNNSVSVCHLNQSSMDQMGLNNVDGKTANFSTDKRRPSDNLNKKQKSHLNMRQSSNKQNKNCQNYQQSNKILEQTDNLQQLSRERLIDLLKSTSQYRQFAFYYDSHQLSYLKRLQVQHKKNCRSNHSLIQQKYWAPTEILKRMKEINKQSKMNLNESQVQEIVGEMKSYFQMNQQIKMRQTRGHYHNKIQKLKRQKSSGIPYDLVRLSNAKQRQTSQIGKKRTNSIKS